MDPAAYAREIETYLCRKNDGHLIRVVGPSFDVVSGWAASGVPLKVAFLGIDRYFERYYRRGPRRRPVKIDFCEADVLDAFDEWRRSVGVASGGRAETDRTDARVKAPSLRAHLERVLTRLTSARAAGSIGPECDPLLDRVAVELDAARSSARGMRGEPRDAMIRRLEAIDDDLLDAVREMLPAAARDELAREAAGELVAFRTSMSDAVFSRAHAASVDRLLRERFGLPVVAYKHREPVSP